MQDDLAFAIIAFTSLLVVYNPLSAMPMFASLTADDSRRERFRTAGVGVLTSVVVMVVFTFAGFTILRFFGITTEAFQITGGGDLLRHRHGHAVGQAFRVKTTRREQDEAAGRESLAIIPLGLPTLAGPGTIVTVITLAGQAVNRAQLVSVYVAALLVGAVTLPCLMLAPALLGSLGRTGLNVVTRLMGLLVMVVGVQLAINGVRHGGGFVGHRPIGVGGLLRQPKPAGHSPGFWGVTNRGSGIGWIHICSLNRGEPTANRQTGGGGSES